MVCRATLKNINNGSYSKKAAIQLFGSVEPIVKLSFSRSEFFTEGPKHVQGMSISGVQQKLSLKINNKDFDIVSTGGEFILKPSPESFPYASENEHCAMALSAEVGINTALCALICFADGENVYITKRYDRTKEGKLHQEDLAQGFNIPSSEKYSKSYEEVLNLVHKMSGGKLSVVRDLFNRIVFAYLIGNDDMHLKNISLIKNRDNPSLFYDSLSPNYDQLFSSSFDKSSVIGFLALDLLNDDKEGIYSPQYQKYGFYTGFDFIELGRRGGLPLAAVQRILTDYKLKEEAMLAIIKRSFMPQLMKDKASSLLKERIKAISIY